MLTAEQKRILGIRFSDDTREALRDNIRIVPLSNYLQNTERRQHLIKRYEIGFADIDVIKHLWPTLPHTEEEIAQWLNETAENNNSPYFLILPQWFREPIGHAGLRIHNDTATSSIVIFHTDYWDCGVGSRVLELVLSTVKFPEHVKYLRAHIKDDHKASQVVYERNGFSWENRHEIEGGNNGRVYQRSSPNGIYFADYSSKIGRFDGDPTVWDPYPVYEI